MINVDDLFLGGMFCDPVKVFVSGYIPKVKYWKKDLYEISKQEFIDTGTVNLCTVDDKMKAKDPKFKVTQIIDLMEAYGAHRSEQQTRRMYWAMYEGGFCKWPRDDDAAWEIYAKIIDAVGVETAANLINKWGTENAFKAIYH